MILHKNNHRITCNTYKWPATNRAVFISYDGAGCAIVEKFEDIKPRLYHLNVAPNARRHGLATALMEAAEAWCKEQGYDRVELEWSAEESEPWVAQWYARRGYEEVEIDGLGRYALMEKQL